MCIKANNNATILSLKILKKKQENWN